MRLRLSILVGALLILAGCSVVILVPAIVWDWFRYGWPLQ